MIFVLCWLVIGAGVAVCGRICGNNLLLGIGATMVMMTAMVS